MLTRQSGQSTATLPEVPGQDFVMRRNIVIIHLLLALALLPVAQAIGPLAAPADSAGHAHESMVMDCGQVDPGHCVDFESCVSGSHASCDANFKSTHFVPGSTDRLHGQVYAPQPPDHYLSRPAERLLRPPRNA